MNKITKYYIEIGLFKELLYEKKIITEEQLNLTIQEVYKKIEEVAYD